jgi:hypothetical protein
MVLEIDLAEGSEDCGTDFENGGGDGVTEDEVALVV